MGRGLERWIGMLALAALSGLGAPASAVAAVTYSATAAAVPGDLSPGDLAPGDLVTIDITLRSDGEPVYALQASATGYDPSVLEFVSGEGVPSVLNQICLPQGCFGGIVNDAVAGSGIAETTANPLGPQVMFMRGLITGFTTQTGAADSGVSGAVGDAQFRLTFRLLGMGATTIEIGADPAYGDATTGADGSVVSTIGTSISLVVVPEPGAATLLALGLAGLTRVRRPHAEASPSPRA